ncbi:GNAT family N-acetyltransferase [Microbacterium sp. bgisy189]|uniref:GNAT family N-acetyltransferase n=1 Tax=Microbacterium sp. bgisy189 TaxID=3413798 RepID=UPI003EB6FE41
MTQDWTTRPVDETSAARLRDGGLDMRLVTGDAVRPWLQAVARGFQGPESSEEQLDASVVRNADKRITGIYDASAPHPDVPVGTVDSWIGELTLPGRTTLPAAAISAVTVAQTHRRRGIARAMLEGELRAAVSAGVPIAMLTVSESTLYGRYGFGVATTACTIEIDVKRADWVGPRPGGRVDLISRESARDLVAELHDRVRLSRPGDISLPPGHEDRFTGTAPDAKEGGKVRCVRYADADGAARGILTYTVSENHDDFTKAKIDVVTLITETDDAAAALWRYLVDHDLVGTVSASLRSPDDPVVWMIDDVRAATRTLEDHQYLRVLDVPAVLQARRYDRVGRVVLEVTDPLGIAEGRYLLQTNESGAGSVSAAPDDAATDVRLGVSELSSAVLGSVDLRTLARAGRVTGSGVSAAAALLSWPEAAVLGIWY